MADNLQSIYNVAVEQALPMWNKFRDAKSNIFSDGARDLVNVDYVPDSIKNAYNNMRDAADGATMGLASSQVLTKGMRYSKFINKGIDVGLDYSEKIAEKMNSFEDRVNEKIDDRLYAQKNESELNTKAPEGSESKLKEGRELPVIKPNEPEEDYIPRAWSKYM